MTTSVWTAGTAQVTNGSTALVGLGTGWESAAVGSGIFVMDGLCEIILSVEGELNATFANPWVGPDSAGNYSILRGFSDASNIVDLFDRLTKALKTLSMVSIKPNGVGTLAKRDSLVLGDTDVYVFLHAELGEDFEYFVWDGPTDESWLGPYPVAIPPDAPTDGILSSNGSITNIIAVTQVAYDALSPPDPTTLYVIKD